MRALIAWALFSSVVLAQGGDIAAVESAKIQYLITAIETLDHAVFIRNGTGYDAKTAADHLRLKLRNAGSRVRSAEDFIKYCASVSSISGEPYEIRFADGYTITSEAFLRGKLAAYGRP